MSSVKGSKQYRLEVKPYRPVYRFLIRLTVLLLVAGFVYAAHWYGKTQALSYQEQALEERDQFEAALQERQIEAETLRQEVANLRLGSKVDQAASEDVRNEVIALKAKIAELEEDIGFYRGLMSPSAESKGLTIGSLNVISTGVARHFNYKLVLQQLTSNHQLLTGSVTFTIVGRQGELPMRLALKDVSSSVNDINIRLGFKYFQNVEGELVLPEGFEPNSIEIVAKVRGSSSAAIEKKFGWLAEAPAN
ncbi:hypothetical protein QWY82_06090 [Simiduia curdlanivorans]|uniref:DUF6776 family protein n=1 Tax=Simiduia curdlanivorans TaxID=1492769 RepID=A0ABV8V333_9GAMM|nr:DUF6776 family protein [Simiduia curdlanivorans]MDN3638383.1 hypothetical protein [Simiduia curdlanivorans]